MATGIVIDASVVVAALVDAGDHGRWSEEAIGRGFIVAPELVVIESLNILRRLERARQVTELEASTAQRDLQELEIELVSVRPFEDRIWQLRHNLTCYDAWYVSVAEAFDLPLATLDHRLARSTGPKCEFCTP